MRERLFPYCSSDDFKDVQRELVDMLENVRNTVVWIYELRGIPKKTRSLRDMGCPKECSDEVGHWYELLEEASRDEAATTSPPQNSAPTSSPAPIPADGTSSNKTQIEYLGLRIDLIKKTIWNVNKVPNQSDEEFTLKKPKKLTTTQFEDLFAIINAGNNKALIRKHLLGPNNSTKKYKPTIRNRMSLLRNFLKGSGFTLDSGNDYMLIAKDDAVAGNKSQLKPR